MSAYQDIGFTLVQPNNQGFQVCIETLCSIAQPTGCGPLALPLKQLSIQMQANYLPLNDNLKSNGHRYLGSS